MKRAAFVVVLLVACACGGKTVSRATETLRLAHGATNAAQAAFVEWDSAHQESLVGRAKTAEDARAAVDAYRRKRAHVMRSFAVAYSAIAAAATLIPLVDSGKRSVGELVSLVVIAADAVGRLADQIADLKEAGP